MSDPPPVGSNGRRRLRRRPSGPFRWKDTNYYRERKRKNDNTTHSENPTISDLGQNRRWIRRAKNSLSSQISRCTSLGKPCIRARLPQPDGTLHKIVTTVFCRSLLYHAVALLLRGYGGIRRVYNTTRRLYYWTDMESDIYSNVERFLDCKNVVGTWCINASWSFLSSWPPKYFAINTPRPLSRTKSGDRFVALIADCFSKLIRALPIKRAQLHTFSKSSWMPGSCHKAILGQILTESGL